MPWKNGLGTTTQLAIFPPNAEFTKGDFLWRLSCAEVHANNSFSLFPGYERILTVLKGQGFVLNGTRLILHQIFEFKGETQINCELIGGPVEDLGLIYKTGIRARMEIIEVLEPFQIECNGGFVLLYSISGEWSFDERSLSSSNLVQLSGTEICKVFLPGRFLLKISIEMPKFL